MRVGFPIRKSADQRLLASPRSLSQRATSFIASWRQGIHRTLLSRSIYTTNARTQDQTPRRSHQLTKLTDSASLIHSFVHDTTIPHKALAPRSTASLVTNQSDSPVKHHAPWIRSPLRTYHQAANPLCSGTSSSKECPSRHSTHQTYSLETVGIEPTAPCLQSRCSTTELRPHNQRTNNHTTKPSPKVMTRDAVPQPSRGFHPRPPAPFGTRQPKISGGPRRT